MLNLLLIMMELLNRRNIKFYYIPAPLPESVASSNADFRNATARVKELLGRYDNCRFMDDLQFVCPDARFVDGTHMDEAGLKLVHEKLDGFLWDVQSRKRPELQTGHGARGGQ